MLHDDPALGSSWITLLAKRLALDDFVKADAAADLRQNGNHVRIPFAQQLPWLNHLSFLDKQGRPVGNAVILEDAVLGAHDQKLAVASEGHTLNLLRLDFDLNGADALELDGPGLLGLDLAFLNGAARHAADVKRPHG